MATPQSRKEKEVWAACDRLKKQGKQLSYRTIGETLVAMGFCKGSHSDLYRYLSSWKAQQEKVVVPKRSAMAKEGLLEPVRSYMEDTLRNVSKEHYQDFVRLFAHHQTQCDRYLQLIDKLKAANKKLFEEIRQLTQALSKKEAESLQLRASLAVSESAKSESL